MAAKTLLVLLGLVCCLNSLNASQWDYVPVAPSASSGDELLAIVADAKTRVQQAVETCRSLTANQTNAEADALAEVDDIVAKWAQTEIDFVESAQEDKNAANERVISCINSFNRNLKVAKTTTSDKAKSAVRRVIQDVTAKTTAAEALVAKIDAVVERAQAEAAKPANQFGGGVKAILAAANDIVKDASYNSYFVSFRIKDLKPAVSPYADTPFQIAGYNALNCLSYA